MFDSASLRKGGLDCFAGPTDSDIPRSAYLEPDSNAWREYPYNAKATKRKTRTHTHTETRVTLELPTAEKPTKVEITNDAC